MDQQFPPTMESLSAATRAGMQEGLPAIRARSANSVPTYRRALDISVPTSRRAFTVSFPSSGSISRSGSLIPRIALTVSLPISKMTLTFSVPDFGVTFETEFLRRTRNSYSYFSIPILPLGLHCRAVVRNTALWETRIEEVLSASILF